MPGLKSVKRTVLCLSVFLLSTSLLDVAGDFLVCGVVLRTKGGVVGARCLRADHGTCCHVEAVLRSGIDRVRLFAAFFSGYGGGHAATLLHELG